MVRVSNKLRHSGASLLFCAAVVGCGGGDDEGESAVLRANLIQFSPMFSAFDDNAHEYQITPSVPIADPASTDSDPLVADSLKWDIDSSYASQGAWGELPGAVLLTTKKVGNVVVKASGTTKSGLAIRGEAMLTISQASPEEWDAGEARYNNGNAIDFNMIRQQAQAAMQQGAAAAGGTTGGNTCGLPVSFNTALPTNSACSNCHNNMASSWSVEHTPTQTAGYSDDELVQIFTQAQKPEGGKFNSPILSMVANTIGADTADCIYKSFHTWEIDETAKRGVVWKLRSITPKRQAAIDFARLAQMAAQASQNAPAAGGAAGAAP